MTCALLGSAVRAQDPHVSMFNEVSPFVNPASVGLQPALNLTALYRSQWVGLNGHPVTQLIVADMPVYGWSSGVGMVLTNDIAGAQRVTTLRLAYGYQRVIKPSTVFSIGLSGGVMQHALDGTKLRAPEGTYSTDQVNHNDPRIPSTRVAAFAPDFGLGMLVRAKSWWAGVSASHLLAPTTVLEVAGLGLTEITFNRSLLVHGGVEFPIGTDLTISPSVLAKSDLVIHQAELQSRVTYRDNIWAGVAFRGFSSASVDALIGMVGMQITSGLRAGYAYDLSLSDLNRVNHGTHEIFVNYRISVEPPSRGKIINNPRHIAI